MYLTLANIGHSKARGLRDHATSSFPSSLHVGWSPIDPLSRWQTFCLHGHFYMQSLSCLTKSPLLRSLHLLAVHLDWLSLSPRDPETWARGYESPTRPSWASVALRNCKYFFSSSSSSSSSLSCWTFCCRTINMMTTHRVKSRLMKSVRSSLSAFSIQVTLHTFSYANSGYSQVIQVYIMNHSLFVVAAHEETI